MNAVLPDLPITALLPQICASLSACPRLVLEAPPGAGKTTQVPLALLTTPWLLGRKIIMLEPRRIAARAAAQFMAQQLGEQVGQTIGYRIRFESQVSAATRVEVVTEGILTTLIQRDPELAGDWRSPRPSARPGGGGDRAKVGHAVRRAGQALARPAALSSSRRKPGWRVA